jgi:hypothetical protein
MNIDLLDDFLILTISYPISIVTYYNCRSEEGQLQ